ncbi:LysM peptidoglycan-binding domain-containing protein [Shimia ponticola]|uniref:LysM peptidoglycan-binding domain-containing protein n=1 Tax=Shimia ponticola TaxID=2582893 RepID=UPI0011BF3DB6|nr:LysM peptidoglycan-binding domain-containing protein [Shimia ponticola]
MAKLALGAGTTVAGAATTVVAVVGGVAWFAVQEPNDSPATPEVIEAAQPAPIAEPAETEAVAESTAEEETVLPNPTFDVVQVENDGQTLVAGVAEPGEAVDILIDDVVAGTATTDGTGRFVAFLSVEPSDDARIMELRAGRGDAARRSDQTIVISPFAAPADTQVAALPEAPVVDEPSVQPETEVAEAEVVASEEESPEPEAVADLAPAPEAPQPEPNVLETAEAEPVEDAEPSVDGEQTVVEVAEAPAANVDAPQVPKADPVEEAEVAEAPVEDPEAVEEVVEAATEEAEVPVIVAEAAPEPEPEVASEQEAAPAAPSVLLADSEGVQVLQSSQPLISVALDSITYDQAGEVSLGGRSTSEGFVRVYLDDQPVTVSRIKPDGRWRTDLPSVDTGVYQLRVDELDTDGNVLSRIETPFKREEPELVAELQAEQLDTGIVTQDVLTVQPGATLWAIARERYGEGTLFVKVFEANRDRIRDPDLIYPGQVFDLPN